MVKVSTVLLDNRCRIMVFFVMFVVETLYVL